MRRGISRLDRSISRREFFKHSCLVAGFLALSPKHLLRPVPNASKPKVVHVHGSQATDWDFSTGWYGDHVDQDVVHAMVDWGVMELTGTTNRAAAWRALMPSYSSGQRVAIKVNLNNAQSESDNDNIIDALIEPVNGIIRGLTEIGVAESDIWVFDAIRPIPDRLRNRCAFVGVQFSGSSGPNSQGFSLTEKVTFQPSGGAPPLESQRISNVLVSADYLINIPIMKKHCCAWVTLSFKNHLGSIENAAALHNHIFPYEHHYAPDYSPLVDIYKNRHFSDKTILTIGDGLFGTRDDQSTAPRTWATFGNRAPNSLFFSQDPVAIDCVMYDFLEAEAGVPSGADDYLVLAAQEGLGVFEHRAPDADGPEAWYNAIDYVYLDLDQPVRLEARCEYNIANLSWTRLFNPDVSGYRIYYTSETGGPASEGTSPLDIPDPDQLTLRLTGLTLYSLYELWVEPYDGSGDTLAESNHAFILPTDILVYLPLIQ